MEAGKRRRAKRRNLYQKSVMDLAAHVTLFNHLASVETLFVAPPDDSSRDWTTFASAMQRAQQSGDVNPGLRAFGSILGSYHDDQPDSFNATVADYLGWVKSNLPSVDRRAKLEVLFNYFDPFIQCMALYVLVFLLTCASWLAPAVAGATLRRTALWVMLFTLAFHTLGLAARIYIQGRPP